LKPRKDWPVGWLNLIESLRVRCRSARPR